MLLAGTCYDPATAVTKSVATLIAMTAFDTTNLRLTFTVPANGIVMVRIRCAVHGTTTFPTFHLGVLEGSTVKGRVAPNGGVPGTNLATTIQAVEGLFTVSGLTPGASLTWDAAYGVETVTATSGIKYGGPNNATANNAWGGLQFEIYSVPNCIASILYDPTTSVSKVTTAALAMTAFDTTNLRAVFTAPASGKVLVKIQCTTHGAATMAQILLGVLEGSTVKGRVAPIGALRTGASATTMTTRTAEFVVTGLTPGNSYTWDAAYGVVTLVASTGIKYGGANDTTTDNAFGGLLYEIWAV